MSSFKFLLSSLLCFLSFSVFSDHCSAARCNVDDETSLLAFKSGITRDKLGLLSTWKSGTDCCTWLGVTCQQNGRVEVLQIFGGQDEMIPSLSGTISPSLSKLRYLKQFIFPNIGNITGPFPTFLLNLPDMEYIYINDNFLSGPIPVDIGTRLPRLVHFKINGNRFTGPIPKSISKLTQLTQLDLSKNALTGTIPDGIRNLHNLTDLNLDRNQLSGKIPDAFGSFHQLVFLNLTYNKLTGKIPPSISMATTLTNLHMGHNSLTGEIPELLGNLVALYNLDLSSNHLTGVVPSSFKNLTNLLNLNLGRNALVGPFPEMNVTEIFVIDLSYNKFNLEKVPKWIMSSPRINLLKLAGCGLKFRLDDFKPKPKYFYLEIDFSDNRITGSPINLLNRSSLFEEFLASNNQLKFNMSNLIILQNLRSLNLSRNQVFGKIPKSIAGLESVDLSYNHLCGRIPATNKRFPIKSFEGNDCLCGSPLPRCK